MKYKQKQWFRLYLGVQLKELQSHSLKEHQSPSAKTCQVMETKILSIFAIVVLGSPPVLLLLLTAAVNGVRSF
jgi:hypothetical protein